MSDLPYGWTIAPLGELVDVRDNQRIPVSAAERATRPGSVPYYGATGQVGYIDRAIFNESLVLLGEDGVSFLDAAKPKAYAISGPSWVNNHAHVLRSDEKVLDQRYLLHYLNCFDYHDYATGTTRLKLTKSAMTQIPVRLPPLAEQRRIIAALEDQLSVIDSGRSTLRAAQRKAFLFMAAAREAAFHSGSHEPTVRLCEILREPLRNGCSGPVTTNGSGVRVITLTAVTRNQFSDKNAKLCDIGNRDVSGLWLEPGDILIQRANTPDLVGTAALYSGEPNWAIFPDLLIRIRVNGNVLAEFLSASLSTRRMRQYFKSSAKGLAGTMPKIDQGTVGRATLWLPSLDVQRHVVERIGEIDRVVLKLNTDLELAERRAGRLRASLLVDAFSGRLVPQNPADEPAGVPLAQIRAERPPQLGVKHVRRIAKNANPA